MAPTLPTDLSPLTLDIALIEGQWEEILNLEDFQNQTIDLLNRLITYACPFLEQAEVSIALMGDKGIQALNKAYRGIDKPTNVLSFGSLSKPLTARDIKPYMPLILGDIVLSLDTLLREATEQSKPFDHHLKHLLVHGFLHLIGYDHIDDKEADLMESLEITVLKDIGISNPYVEQ